MWQKIKCFFGKHSFYFWEAPPGAVRDGVWKCHHCAYDGGYSCYGS